MSDLIVHYHPVSPERQRKRDRIQLLFASIALGAGFFDSFSSYRGFLVLVPILAFVFAAANIVVFFIFNYLYRRFGEKFEISLLRMNGVLLLFTGFSFHFVGRHHVQYVYYAFGFLYLFVLPALVRRRRKNRYIVFFTDRLKLYRIIRPVKEILWQNLESVVLFKGILELKKIGKKNKKYHLDLSDKDMTVRLKKFLKGLKKNYSINLQVLD